MPNMHIGPAADNCDIACIASACVYMYDIVYKRGCVYSVEYIIVYMYVCRVIGLKDALTLWARVRTVYRPRCCG